MTFRRSRCRPRLRWAASLLTLLCVGSTIGAARAAPPAMGTWTDGAPAPTHRSEVAAGVIGGKIFLLGGFEEPGPNDVLTLAVSRTVEQYDPIWNGWTAKAPLPARLHHAAVAVVDRQLFVIGGFTQSGVSVWQPTAAVYRYDVASDTWTERQSMPTARGALGAAVVDGKIIAVGGYNGTGNPAAVESYDPATDTWSTMASLPTPRDHLAVVAFGRDLYAIGGRLNKDYGRNLAVVEQFHPATNRWTRKMDLAVPRSGVAAAVVSGRIYVFGGEAPDGTIRSTEVYNPETDRWDMAASMPTARHGLAAAVVEDRIYVLGGGPKPGGTFSNLNEIFIAPRPETTAQSSGRASASQVGAVMAILSVWSEAGVLPPENTPDASRIVKALIQFQSAMMKSGNPHVVKFFDAAFQQKFGHAAEQAVRAGRREGWTSRSLEAMVEYGTGPPRWDRAGLEQGWREFNLAEQDLRLLAGLHFAARNQYAAEGKDIHMVYEEKRRLMPGAR